MAKNPEAAHKHAHTAAAKRSKRDLLRRLIPRAISKSCNASIRAGNDSGPRTKSQIHLVIIHCTESPNPGAHGVALFFRSGNPSNGIGSTQLITDDAGCYRTLPDLVIPWGAPSANTAGVHIEQCGYTAWSRAEWLKHLATIKRCAYKAAKACHAYGIPPVWLSPAQLRAGQHGVSSHANVSLAWPVPGAHTDPGPNYPLDKFKFWLAEYYKELARGG